MDPNKNYNLAQFMEEIVPEQRSADVFYKSPVVDKIHDVVGHEYLTEPIVATFFWQIVTYTDFYDYVANAYDIRAPKSSIDQMVVSHGGNKYSLLVLVPGLQNDQHYVMSVNSMQVEEIRNAYFKWQRTNQIALGQVERGYATKKVTQNEIDYLRIHYSLFNSVEPGFVESILNDAKMNIVLSRKPDEELTNSYRSKSFHKVISNINENSTAGIYGIKIIPSNGGIREVFGVTVCRHGLTGELGVQHLMPNVIGQEVVINGLKGKVLSDDPISDSCFVELDQALVKEIEPCVGPLQIFPNQNSQLYFEGATSGRKTTFAMAWDTDLLTPEPLVQKRFSTPRVTNKGDSGAGLYDQDGKVLGFSFSKSKLGQQPEYSKWIWADSVFQFHNLKI